MRQNGTHDQFVICMYDFLGKMNAMMTVVTLSPRIIVTG
jgi:hypothetical protein